MLHVDLVFVAGLQCLQFLREEIGLDLQQVADNERQINIDSCFFYRIVDL